MKTVYIVKPTGKFRKDYNRMASRELDMSLLDEIIIALAQGKKAPFTQP